MKAPKNKPQRRSGAKAPIINGLNKHELKLWLAFCKSVNSNL